MIEGSLEHLIHTKYQEDFPGADAAQEALQFPAYMLAFNRAYQESHDRRLYDRKIERVRNKLGDRVLRRIKANSDPSRFDSEHIVV